jgi:hypothetical protein
VRGKPRRPVLGILLDAAGEWQEFFLEGAKRGFVTHLKSEVWGIRVGAGFKMRKANAGPKSKCRSTHAFAAANALAQDNKSYGVLI